MKNIFEKKKWRNACKSNSLWHSSMKNNSFVYSTVYKSAFKHFLVSVYEGEIVNLSNVFNNVIMQIHFRTLAFLNNSTQRFKAIFGQESIKIISSKKHFRNIFYMCALSKCHFNDWINANEIVGKIVMEWNYLLSFLSHNATMNKRLPII